jgi:hypothetical protein
MKAWTRKTSLKAIDPIKLLRLRLPSLYQSLESLQLIGINRLVRVDLIERPLPDRRQLGGFPETGLWVLRGPEKPYADAPHTAHSQAKRVIIMRAYPEPSGSPVRLLLQPFAAFLPPRQNR